MHITTRCAPLVLFFSAVIVAAETPNKPVPENASAGKNTAATECVYEGRGAVEWGKDLRAGQNPEKAAHALLQLGKDAVPVLTQMLKEHDPKLSAQANGILTAMKHNRDAVAIFTLMLRDSDFDVRRSAVKVLGEFAAKDPAAKTALQEALKDRDKAVVEAAEQELDQFTDRRPLLQTLLKQASAALAQSQFDRASALANDALAIDAQNDAALRILELARLRVPQLDDARRLQGDDLNQKTAPLITEALKEMQKANLAKATELANEILAIDPLNDKARRLLEVIRKEPLKHRPEADENSSRKAAPAEPPAVFAPPAEAPDPLAK